MKPEPNRRQPIARAAGIAGRPARQKPSFRLSPTPTQYDRHLSVQLGITLQQVATLKCRGLLETKQQIRQAGRAIDHLRLSGLYSHSSFVDVIAAVQRVNRRQDDPREPA